MNVFIGVGKISNVTINGRLLKFILTTSQEKPCNIPCVIFDPSEDMKVALELFIPKELFG